ncbi:MAG TPA: hypothetical protein DCE42_21855, partial [Myxococcales bacterium]|nr:hypothetical protein [Myxococcales bacterium]
CEEPCGGADCGSGKCCQASSNQCIDNPQPCADLQCPPGTDPPPADQFTTDPKSCEQTGPKCECIKRKPLPVGEAGLDSEIALLSGKAVVSAYNKTYGDLVVGFEQADGTVKWEFVDGIPAGGKVVGAADGPRGGIEDGGDDVGLYTSIAVANTNVYVSYHDKTNGTLKFALRKGDAWTTHVVDKTGKGVGRYTSLTMANGNPAIAYFVVDDGSGNTALRVAVAKSAEPGAETDWTITTVTSAALPACKGACDAAKKEVCVQEGTAFSCKVPTAKEADCKPTACKDGEEACVSGKCLKIVADVANPPLPKGIGLFPSVASNAAGALYITFYDNNKGDLKLARQPAAGGKFTVSTLDSTGDVGQFTSLALDAQERGHVAYVDIDNGDIKYVLFDKAGKVLATEVVDDGFTNSATGGEEHLLADCSIAVDSTGKPRIVYQDATVQSIKMAIQTNPKQWTKKKLAGAGGSEAGAFGFFADQVLNNNTSHISNYRYDLKNDNSGLNLRTWQP